MAKLIIFDMDQTLLDLVPFHDKAYSRVFKEVFGIETTFEKIDHSGKSYPVITREIGALEGVDKNKIEQNIPQVVSLFQKYFTELVSSMKVEPLFGAKELLEQLSADKNNTLVVASASPKNTVELSLTNAGLRHFFKQVETADDADVKKEIVELIKNKIDSKKEMKTFMIGDAIEDMEAGKNINATTIGLTTGSHSEKDLKSHGAKFVFNKIEVDNILKIIKN